MRYVCDPDGSINQEATRKLHKFTNELNMKMEDYQTELLGVNGLKIVRNPKCKTQYCYGRGYTGLIEEAEFVRLCLTSQALKEAGKIPKDWNFGRFIQCPNCLKFFKTNALNMKLEEMNATRLPNGETDLQYTDEDEDQSGEMGQDFQSEGRVNGGRSSDIKQGEEGIPNQERDGS